MMATDRPPSGVGPDEAATTGCHLQALFAGRFAEQGGGGAGVLAG